MRLTNKKALEKLKKKNRGNVPLSNAIDKLIKDIEDNEWKDQTELNITRQDADCVHSDGFYFFNINIHRTMILIELMMVKLQLLGREHTKNMKQHSKTIRTL